MKSSLPSFFKSILWSYDIEKIDPVKSKNLIVIQSINYGRLQHLRWIKDRFGSKQIEKVIISSKPTEFKDRQLRISKLLLKIK